MKHLSDDELLAVVEGMPSRDDHLVVCAACRAEVEALASVLRDAAAMQVPEPSPLFWDHFSARVREACSREAPGARGLGSATANQEVGRTWTQKPGIFNWRPWRVVGPAIAAVLLLLAGSQYLVHQPTTSPPASAGTTAAALAVPTVPPADEPVAADESWHAFAALASEADPAGSAFDTPPPGLADGAVLQMSDEERGELIRLLQDELARRGARGRG